MARNGARYFLCRLSATSPHFAKYPRTPVVLCAGHAPQSMTTAQVLGPGLQRR